MAKDRNRKYKGKVPGYWIVRQTGSTIRRSGSVKFSRGGKDRRLYAGDLDDLSFDWFEGKLHMTAEVTQSPYSTKKTYVCFEFTPSVLAQLATAAASCEAHYADDDSPYIAPWDTYMFRHDYKVARNVTRAALPPDPAAHLVIHSMAG